MTDTLWADISEFQVVVTDAYPHQVLTIRSSDNDYHDKHYAANREWAGKALSAGRLEALIVYYFWRPGGTAAATHMAIVGKPLPRMATMIDVEAGSGTRANHSAELNAEYEALARWHGDPRKVIGYGNPGDLEAIWPSRPRGIKLVIADYGANPAFPGKWAHQFSDSYDTPPFGPCDINSCDGHDLAQVLASLGMG